MRDSAGVPLWSGPAAGRGIRRHGCRNRRQGFDGGRRPDAQPGAEYLALQITNTPGVTVILREDDGTPAWN
jgi:hypothetical protein